MADDAERLVVLLEARIKDLERNMAKAAGTTDTQFNRMRRSSKSATKQMEEDAKRSTTRINQAMATVGTKVGSYGAAFAGGLVAGGAVAALDGIRQAAMDSVKSVVELGDQATMAGLSFKAFQEWKYVAEQARIPVDAITDGLKELSLRADEFAVTGKGSAAEAFQRLGLAPAEVKERLKDPSDLMLLIIERTRQMKDTAAGVRIFDELFGGTGGERMVSLIEQGEAGIRAQMQAANDFGRVLSDDVIVKAQEIDRQFNAISQTVGTVLKSAVVSVVASLMDFIDGLRAIENRRSSTIQSSINDIMAQKQEVAKALAEVDAADSKLNDRQKARAKGQHQIKMQQLNEQENALIKELENRPEVMNFTPKNSGAWTPPTYTAPTSTGSKGGSKAKTPRQNDYERTVEQIEERTEALKAETEAQAGLNPLVDDFGYSVEFAAARQDLLTSAQKAGIQITPELSAKIDKLAASYANAYVEAEKLEDKNQRMKETKEDFKNFLSTIRSGIMNGDSFWDAFGDAGMNVLDKLISKIEDELATALVSAFSAGGSSKSGGGLFGSLFSGFFSLFSAKGDAFSTGGVHAFAKGGAFTNKIVDSPTMFRFANGTGLMGEAGPEAIVPLSRDASGRLGITMNGSDQSSGTQSVKVENQVVVTIEDDKFQAYVRKVSQTEAEKVGQATLIKANKSAPFVVGQYQKDKTGGDYRNL